jgi:hypothetical protein
MQARVPHGVPAAVQDRDAARVPDLPEGGDDDSAGAALHGPRGGRLPVCTQEPVQHRPGQG